MHNLTHSTCVQLCPPTYVVHSRDGADLRLNGHELLELRLKRLQRRLCAHEGVVRGLQVVLPQEAVAVKRRNVLSNLETDSRRTFNTKKAGCAGCACWTFVSHKAGQLVFSPCDRNPAFHASLHISSVTTTMSTP